MNLTQALNIAVKQLWLDTTALLSRVQFDDELLNSVHAQSYYRRYDIVRNNLRQFSSTYWQLLSVYLTAIFMYLGGPFQTQGGLFYEEFSPGNLTN